MYHSLRSQINQILVGDTLLTNIQTPGNVRVCLQIRSTNECTPKLNELVREIFPTYKNSRPDQIARKYSVQKPNVK